MLHNPSRGAHMRLLHLAMTLGLVALPSALTAQAPDTLTPAQRAGLALARLGAGQRVRIVTRDSEFVEGSVMAASPNLLRLRTDGTLILPASRVDSLWVRGGSHAGTGALIGGAVLGIGLGVLAQGFSHAEGGCNEPGYGRGCGPAPFFEGLLIGGAAGALVGALIGAPFPKWQLRVP